MVENADMGNARTSGLDWCGANVLGGERTAAAVLPHSARLTRTASFLWGWKALQPVSRAQVTAVLLAVWNPGDRNHISSLHYAGGLSGESSRLFQYILSLKISGRANRVEQGVGPASKALHCWGVRTVQLIQQREEQGGMSFCKLMLLVRFTRSLTLRMYTFSMLSSIVC